MRVRDLIAETASAIDSNRGRTALTVLGIVIGIAAVIAMTALIDGIKLSLVGDMGLNQARMVSIYAWPGREVTQRDLDAVEQGVSDYEFITGTSYGSSKLSNGTKEIDSQILGCEPEYFTAMGTILVQGRFFTAEEADGGMVAILDQNMVRELWGSADEQVIGSTIKLGNDSYSIVGVAESTNVYTTLLYIPLTTMGQRITGRTGIDQIIGFAREEADMDAIADKTKNYICSYFNIEPDGDEGYVEVMTMKSLLDQVNSMMMSFQLLMTSVAGISLLVGGIGIMNMMLTNVTERIREIGLRKALGARASDITRQFLLESIVICIAGGVLGVALGFAGAWLVASVAGSALGYENVTPVITPGAVMLAAGICIGIGIVFGYGPARRAAKLDPVESLRYQ